ncbi:BH3751 [Halalkalibacterium halodurans C-125]|uniref:BH3751 protein n=3 Tax=Halalkalibacterium halodurans TaxID=86665 RepID=Q9K6H8_HALH5|nr:BH3751 [Halalkalibacterium halodurans C-125]
MQDFGQQALIHIVVHVMFLAAVWWALQSFKFDLFVKNPKSPQAMLLMIFVTIALAYLVSSFFLQYLESSLMLRYIWQ